jgi:5-methylthioadenosine/S-adenosylhomocysteine deaminase
MKKFTKILLMILILNLLSCSKESNIDILITDATIVTMNEDSAIFDPGYIAIRNHEIIALGSMSDLKLKNFNPKIQKEATGKILLPGLINGHTHLAMTLLRGIGDDLNLNEWLEKFIFPIEGKFLDKEYVAIGTRLGLAEMIRGGVTTFADMYYYEDIVAEETEKSGMRAILGETLLDFPAPDHKNWKDAIQYSVQFLEKWKENPRITPALAPHAIYTVGEAHLKEVVYISKKFNSPVLTHLAEASTETSYSLSKFKKRPIAYLDSIGFLNDRLIAAHAVQINEDEINLLLKKRAGIIHCPQSNMKLTSGVAPVPKMIDRGILLGIGTDGAASNNDLNLWEEIDTAAKLHKLFTNNPTILPAKQALELATIRGAAALHMENKIGSLKVGKYADLVMIERSKPHQTPIYNFYSYLVYANKASDVTDVMIHGKWVMENKKILTLDEEKVILDAQNFHKKIQKF